MSLGGMRDEAELRGHRRTYIGAMPGRIIQEIRKVGVNNPVFMLDELDKVGADFRGDPTSALLEVLDPAQNKSFQDHYLSVPFDLSKVLFIATANYMGPVPPALRDRMEVIEIPGYAQADKLNIAKQYLVPRQREQNGLKVSQITFKDDAIRRIIEQYTREAGVRELERKIGACCRYVAALVAEGKAKSRTVTGKLLVDALGPRIYQRDVAGRTNVSGVVTGLAHTPSGGDIIFIEAAAYNGKGQLILTGQIGDVMRESAQAAYSLVKSKADGIGIKPEVFAGTDVHIHVPAGAIPKDGPSAGIAILTALTSLFTEHKVRADVAMTGEITLRGLVLPVGGVRVKVLAAKRAGIRRVLLPEDNRKDLQDIPQDVREELEFVFVKTADDVMNAALDLQVSEDPRSSRKAKSSKKTGRSAKKTSAGKSSTRRKSAAGSGKSK
jgi:ATP-dependent Lon protease